MKRTLIVNFVDPPHIVHLSESFFGHAGRPGQRGGSVKADLPATVVGHILRKRGSHGVTVSIHGDIKRDGYAVGGSPDLAGVKTERIIEGRVKRADVVSFIDTHRALLETPNKYVGGWVDAGKTFLDVSEIHNDRESSLALAEKRGEIAIYDLKANESIYTRPDRERPITEAQDDAATWHIFGKDQSVDEIVAVLQQNGINSTTPHSLAKAAQAVATSHMQVVLGNGVAAPNQTMVILSVCAMQSKCVRNTNPS